MLARAGVGSRRAVEELIRAGRVTVNGGAAELGRRVDISKDVVEVDGSRVPLAVDLVYYLMNKPVGVVTTASDPEGRPTVVELVEAPARVWPVGRLDVESEGALLLTNDGELAHRLTHPSFEIERTYLVEVGGGLSEREVRALARGVTLEDGPARATRVGVVQRGAGSALVELVVTEGRNRLVRRMIGALGKRVLRLVRTQIGPLRLGRLKPGTVRRLSPGEVRALYRAAGL